MHRRENSCLDYRHDSGGFFIIKKEMDVYEEIRIIQDV